MIRRTLFGAALAACVVSAGPGIAATAINSNLVINGDGESPTGAGGFSVSVPPTSWTVTTGMTVVRYDVGSASDLNPTVSNAVGGGNNYFAGGPNNSASTATQDISLSDVGPLLDQGRTAFTLGALLGGYGGQNDGSTLRVEFRSASNATISTAQIGPVLAADRSSLSNLLPRVLNSVIPVGTRSVSIVLTATRESGSYNDGYADNLVFRLNAAPGDATLDGRVNFDDLLVLAQRYGTTGTSWIQGDFDRNGKTDFDDLLVLAQHYSAAALQDRERLEDVGFAAEWAMATSIAPEPVLALTTLPMLLLHRRR